MDVAELSNGFADLPNHLYLKKQVISTEILKEITARLQFLLDVGLNLFILKTEVQNHYLEEKRQRIRLATQIGSQLVGVLYILDEPSIGLYQRDNNV